MPSIKIKSYLLLLILTSCSTSSPREFYYEDTTKLSIIKEMFRLSKSLDSLQNTDSEKGIELKQKKDELYKMIDKTLDFKQDRVELQHLQLKAKDISKQQRIIIKQIDSIRTKNKYLIKENQDYKLALIDERNYKNKLSVQKSKLENDLSEASKLVITSFKITGIGTSLTLFGKYKEVETNKENKIKSIKVSFSLPSNPVAKKEIKNISVLAYSTSRSEYLNKDTIIDYVGKECSIQLHVGGKIFKSGNHLIRIYINRLLQFEQEFTVIK